MKDNKICFSKTLLFLVLIGAAIVVGLMAMKTNFSSSTKAVGFVGSPCAVKNNCDVFYFNGKYLQTGLMCTEKNGIKTLQVTGSTCRQEICLYNQINVFDPSNPKYELVDTGTGGSLCIAEKKGGKFINQGATCVRGFYRSQYAKVSCAAAAPAAITCPSTGFKMFGSKCYNMGSKIFYPGTANQYCGNEVMPDLSKCTPTAITCTSTGFKMFGSKCYNMGSKIFYPGTANQYCGNEVMPDLSKCTPTAITCTSTGFKMFGSKCYNMGSKIFYPGTANQYCGNEVMPDLSKCTPTAITCTSTGYGVSGGYCYNLGSKLFNAGTTNQYCGNERMNNFNCCNDPSAAGC